MGDSTVRDSGLQAYYLFLDESNHSFLLDYTFPMGKKTLIGQYTKNGTKVALHRDLVKVFDLPKEYAPVSFSGFDLKHLKELENRY